MSIEHHDLIHEFPEYRQRIHDLKVGNETFAQLFNEYHELTKHVEKMEAEIEPVSTQVEEEMKYRRVQLKDQLYAMMKQ